MMTPNRSFYGKYRGQVTDNRDPNGLGRIRAKVPAVLGDVDSGWALPAVPYAGRRVGFFFIPSVGANVWMEFEAGNPEVPIWSGCFWGAGEPPQLPATPEIKLIRTDSATLTIDDTPAAGGFTLETAAGLKIVMNTLGIELSNGSAKIKLTAASVSINDGALEIT